MEQKVLQKIFAIVFGIMAIALLVWSAYDAVLGHGQQALVRSGLGVGLLIGARAVQTARSHED